MTAQIPQTEEKIRVSEIFGPTIQGEGALIGQPTVFVRTGGCDYRCTWCDTLHAVDSQYRETWTPMTAEAVFAEIKKLSGGEPLMVSLSGGNPAIQPLGPLIEIGKNKGYRFALETQGTIAQAWFAHLNILTLSPKPPSSEMKTDWAKFEECLAAANGKPQIALKIVIFDQQDYDYARQAAQRYPTLSLYLQPGNHTPPSGQNSEQHIVDMEGINARLRWLAEKVTADQWYEATVLPQLHVLIWGNRRGV